MSPIIIKAHENPKLTVLIILKIIPMAINMIPRVLMILLRFLLPQSPGFRLASIENCINTSISSIIFRTLMKRDDFKQTDQIPSGWKDAKSIDRTRENVLVPPGSSSILTKF